MNPSLEHSVQEPAQTSPIGSGEPKARILLVDDQPARLLSYEAVLSDLNVDCVRALSGTEALKQLLANDFAAILLDVNMPEMDGFETARIIREHPRMERIPIIFVTGTNLSDLDQLKGYEVGAIDYIAIPVVPAILRTKVSVLVELYQRRRALQSLNDSMAKARAEMQSHHARALAEQEALLHAMFEHPTEPVTVLEAVRDAQGLIVSWRYRRANTLTLEMLGLTRSELIGRDLTDVLSLDRAQAIGSMCTRVSETGRAQRYEANFRGTDLLVTLFPVGPDCVLSTATDITDHKRTESALRQSEARHRALLENAPVAVAHNAMDGRFEYVNRAFCRLVGYTPEELYEKRWQDITHPDDTLKDQALADQVVTRALNDYSIEKRYIRKDGSVVWAHLFGNFVMNDAGQAVQGVAVAIDITERRAATTALEDSRERLMLAKAAAFLGIHDWDLRTNAITWDERTREIWGATRDEPINYAVFVGGLHPDDIPLTQAAVDKALDPAGDKQYLATYRVINRITGEIHWVEATGRVYFENDVPVRLIGTVQDITDRATVEALVHESEARFRELANNIDQFAWTCDSDGRTTWHNTRWYDYTGATPATSQGREWIEVVHPDQRSEVARRFDACLEAGTAWDDTFQLRSKSGEYRWFLSRAVPIRSDQGTILRWFGTNTDITDLRNLQTALNDASQRKDEFLAMLSHELRNPAAAISNAAQALTRLMDSRGQEHGLLGVIDRQIRHMSKLLDDLLDVARITQGHVEIQRELVTIQHCIDLALETAEPLIQSKRHRLTTTQWFEPLWISGDVVRLAQCITNLLTNAAKYTPAGGLIRLELDADDSTVTLQVQDSGQGISPELLPHIFDLFVQGERTLDRSQGGLGIGLALCRKLIEMQGGSIQATSGGVNLGATFTVRLPRAKAPSMSQQSLILPDKSAHRVLIVDDNRDAAQSLDLILQLEGHATLVAYSGAEALKRAAEFRPEFVLLDIGLPEMDGYEIAQRMKSLVPHARLIAVTGYGLPDDYVKSRQCGFTAHLVKPVSLESIQKAFAAAHAL